MPIFKLKTTQAEKVWASPDGKIKIFKLTMDYNGKPLDAKTYSEAIATVGFEGEVETYEKQGRNGVETFIKQVQKEGEYGARPGRTSYVPKDEKAISAMWAIGQAINVAANSKEGYLIDPKAKDWELNIENIAQKLFLMVDRVKATPADEVAPATGKETEEDLEASIDKTVTEQLPGQLSVEDIKGVFPDAKT